MYSDVDVASIITITVVNKASSVSHPMQMVKSVAVRYDRLRLDQSLVTVQ